MQPLGPGNVPHTMRAGPDGARVLDFLSRPDPNIRSRDLVSAVDGWLAATGSNVAFVAPFSDLLRLGLVVRKLFGSERPVSEIELQGGEIDPQSIEFPVVPFAW
jgi:hypothetical protein